MTDILIYGAVIISIPIFIWDAWLVIQVLLQKRRQRRVAR